MQSLFHNWQADTLPMEPMTPATVATPSPHETKCLPTTPEKVVFFFDCFALLQQLVQEFVFSTCIHVQELIVNIVI